MVSNLPNCEPCEYHPKNGKICEFGVSLGGGKTLGYRSEMGFGWNLKHLVTNDYCMYIQVQNSTEDFDKFVMISSHGTI